MPATWVLEPEVEPAGFVPFAHETRCPECQATVPIEFAVDRWRYGYHHALPPHCDLSGKACLLAGRLTALPKQKPNLRASWAYRSLHSRGSKLRNAILSVVAAHVYMAPGTPLRFGAICAAVQPVDSNDKHVTAQLKGMCNMKLLIKVPMKLLVKVPAETGYLLGPRGQELLKLRQAAVMRMGNAA